MKQLRNAALQLVLLGVLAVLIALIALSTVRGRAENEAQIHSRYTFVVSGLSSGDVGLEEAADIWEQKFLAQFTQSNLPSEKKIRNVRREPVQVLDEDNNIVDLRFSFSPDSSDSEFFSSWGAVMTSSGNLSCEWVVTFNREEGTDQTYSISVSTIQKPEDYKSGLQTDDTSKSGQAETMGSGTQTASSSNYLYRIRNSSLQVSFNGGNSYANVPLEVTRLPYSSTSAEELAAGSYYVSPDITAFLSGGMVVDGTRAPVSLTYSTDMGRTWKSVAIDEIYDVDLYYLRVVSPDDIIVALGYSRTDQTEYSKFYYVSDGSVRTGGSGYKNQPLTGIMFLNDNVGFFSYAYEEGDEGTLYETRDGGKSFQLVQLDSQQLDSGSGNLTWNSVFVQALVPKLDDQGNLVVYVTQGGGTKYNNGKTTARYVSTDEGKTFTYTGQTD